MKKILCFILMITLLLSTVSVASAKTEKENKNHKSLQQIHKRLKETKHEFKLKASPVITFGRYKLPINPVKKGMGAEVTFHNKTAVLTVVKGSITISIDLKKETVTVNGVQDMKSGIFTAKNNKKMTVLIKYIAAKLGMKASVENDKVTIEVPGLDRPTNVRVTPVGTNVVENTLNSTTQYMTAKATIKAGQATGGKAELYVGSKLVATDSSISATDTEVTFTTSDGSPTNAKLQTLLPTGGVVTVRLYNANNQYVTSTVGNPTLVVDYVAPTITGIASAIYNPSEHVLKLTVSGAGAVGDIVDVTRLSIYDSALAKAYQLTNLSGSGSVGVIKNDTLLEIKIGTTDRNGLMGFGSQTMYLNIAAGSLLKDAAGNVSTPFMGIQTIPVSLASVMDQPTNVSITPVGTNVVENTLNGTTQYMTAKATIKAGQATGGKAELYVGSKLVATDSSISATDTEVTFTTSDGSPTNAKLQTLIPTGGVVTVRLYNANNQYVTSTVGNPTLVVDYVAPTITSVTSATYHSSSGILYLTVNGAGTVGDSVDVTKLAFYDVALAKSYQLTNVSGTGSSGIVVSDTTLTVNIGPADRMGLSGFGGSVVYLNISTGSLLKDAAGNEASPFSGIQTVVCTLLP